MNNAFQSRILAVVLATATLAACVLAGFNVAAENNYKVPSDGIWWVEAPSSGPAGLCARQVPTDSPGYVAGVRQGDVLLSVNERLTPRLAPLEQELFRVGSLESATYSILRSSQRVHGGTCVIPAGTKSFDIKVILEPADHTINIGLRLIGIVYLLIGLYVLFRRWTAPKSTHFYVFCLVSFVLYTFKYTGELDAFDTIIYWSNVLATAIQPALFLHFALTFSESIPDAARRKRQWVLASLLYIPAGALIFLQVYALQMWEATELLKHRLDKIAYGYMALYYVWLRLFS